MHQDGYSDLKYYYSYDSIGRLIRTDITDRTTGAAVGSTEFGYNTRGHQTSVTNEIGGRTYEQQYVYSELDGVEGSFANASDGLSTRYGALGKAVDYSYDGLNRLTYRSQNTTTPLTNEYSYATSLRGTGFTTTLLSEEKINGVSYAYTYDSMGNISTIKRGGNDYHSYKYNALGQLVRDNSYTSGGGTYVWEYDGLGNILSKKKYAYTEGNVSSLTPVQTINYEYGNSNLNGWRQLLKTVDLNGNDYVDENEKISYDEIGNPTTYLGATMSWFGRQMRTYSKNGISANFMYDADGLRSAKGVNGVKTTYQYVGDKLFYEKRGNNTELYYFYDSYGKLSAISYVTNGTATPFYVSTNAQGDVLSIHTGSGVKVAQYDYDAWGNATVMVVTTDSDGKYVYTTVTDESAPGHISTLNPIRYRGYYYDEDLELYYLQSRYYDSTIGRFINADGFVSTGQGVLSYNMFAYCLNNPVNMSDPSGCLPVWLVALAVGVLLCLSGCSNETTVTTSQSTNTTTTVSNKGDYTDFTNALGMKESSNNYSAKNSYGFLGKYQMGEPALQDAGFIDSNGNWTSVANSYGIYSEQDFLNSPNGQEAAIKGYHKKVCGYIRSYGLDSYIGETYCGVEITESGLLAACHLVGTESLAKAMSTGTAVWDANGTEASVYMKNFGNYDISEVW